MANFNKVIIAGNLTRDPELRYSQKGTAIARIGLALNRRWKSDSGEQQEETTFVDVDAFGRQAEVISQYVKKGRSLLVEGRLRLDQWEDKQTGQKRSQMRVVLESFSFVSGDRDQQSGDQSGPRPASPPTTPQGSPLPEDDNVPF